MILPLFNLIWSLLCLWLLAPIKEANNSIGSCDEYAKLPLPNASNYSETILFSSRHRDRNSLGANEIPQKFFYYLILRCCLIFCLCLLIYELLDSNNGWGLYKNAWYHSLVGYACKSEINHFCLFFAFGGSNANAFSSKGRGETGGERKKWW